MEIIYQAGNVTGGYAFSANNEVITLSGYVEKLPEEQKNVIIFEANKARELYTAEVARKKAAGEKVNPLTIKRESVAEAKKATQEKFGEELYNAVNKVVEDNKGGTQSVSGKTSKGRTEKSAAPKAKGSKAPKEIPTDIDLDDLEKEFDNEPGDEFDADMPLDDGVEVADPFDEEI